MGAELDFNRLKEEIKKEIKMELLSEAQTRAQVHFLISEPWHVIKEEINKIFSVNKISIEKSNALVNAISVILRHRFSIPHMRLLAEEQKEEARRVALAVLELAGVKKNEKEGVK